MKTHILAVVVSAAIAATLLCSCASSTSPVNTCACADTTQRHEGQLSVAAGAPLAQVSVGVRRVHRIGSDSVYSDVFAGAETKAGVGGTTISLGELSIGDLRIGPQTNNGTTLYGYRGGVTDLPINTVANIGFQGSVSDNIAPYQTSLYVGGSLDVKYYGKSGADVPDTLDATQDLVLTWTPGAEQPAVMRVILEIRNGSGTILSRTDYSGPDDGKEIVPQEALPSVPNGTLYVVVLCERSFIRCSCQPGMQYNLVSWSQQYLYRQFK